MSLRSHLVLASSGRETSPFSTGLPRLEPARSDLASFGRSRAPLSIAFLIAALTLAPLARAQSCANSNSFLASLPTWNTPLDRVVSLRARDISLRDALDRVS